MATRKDFDWQQDWLDWQFVPQETFWDRWHANKIAAFGDWREVPVSFLRGDPTPGRRRLYVVQTCHWYEREEDGWWYPEDGIALQAFPDFAEAKHHARREQPILRERLGVVETECDGEPGDEVHLLKDRRRLRQQPAPGEGRIVAAFTDRLEADLSAHARARVDWRRACDEQPTYFAWSDWTTLPTSALLELCEELGLPWPDWEDPKGEWHQGVWDWWHQTAPLMDGWQRERLRLAMDRFSDYRVVAVPYVP